MVLVAWKSLSSYVSVEIKLEDGTLIGSTTGNHIVEPVGENNDGVAEIDIPPEVSGLHEVIFTANRFAGTHYFAKIMSFEILPPLPTTSPTITSAPTISLVPTQNTGARLERWWGIGGRSTSALTGNSRTLSLPMILISCVLLLKPPRILDTTMVSDYKRSSSHQ